jgi:glycosyltransferase involved in cell wall biosynthesis
MKIAWIFPDRERCGISLYAREYLRALAPLADVEPYDCRSCFQSVNDCAAAVNRCDVIHLQYETSFFQHAKNDPLRELFSRCAKPVVVSLHEVYEWFPGVFPRERITGRGIVLKCKQLLYDLRHPYQTLYARHAASSFHARLVLVHARYHRDILISHGVNSNAITVLPHPVKPAVRSSSRPFMEKGVLRLGSHGFINPAYDYTLLFDALKRITIPWHFTWIGGVRREEDRPLFDSLNKTIALNGWQGKISFTGWVAEDTRDRLLGEMDLYLALYSARSSSGSLATALGTQKCVIATDLPYTRELAGYAPIYLINKNSGESTAATIRHLVSSQNEREQLLCRIPQYISEYSYSAMAARLLDLYRTKVAV